jgi:hypothetical protein
MERFLRRENIKRYRKLLREAKDEAGRRLIRKLLTEEEQEDVTPSSRPRVPGGVPSGRQAH